MLSCFLHNQPRRAQSAGVWSIAAILLLGLSASLQAQYNNPNSRRMQQQPQQGQQAMPVPKEIEGTIAGAMRGAIVILDGNNRSWRVMVMPAAKVAVTGTATADALQSGMIVEFQGEIDDHGALKEKVGELTLVTLSADKQVGTFPIDASNPVGKPAKHAPGKIAAGTYRIVGRLVVARGGKMSVQADRLKLPLELTEQPTISINFADYTLAAKGDKVSVKALAMQSRSGPIIQATEVKIEMAEPLAGAKKKGMAAKHPAKTPAGLPEPATNKSGA